MKLAKFLFTLSMGLSLCACKKKTDASTTTLKNTVTKTTSNKSTTSSGDKLYRRVGNSIYFGSYPQTLVTDTTVTTALTELAGTRGTSSWTKVEKSVNNSSYTTLKYKDIDYEGEKYRVVDILDYINYSTTQPRDDSFYPFQKLNGYEKGNLYCFKFEDVKWNILEEKDGKALIVSSSILDASYYEKISKINTKFMHNAGNGYSADYSLSDIRNWLNSYFYENVFSELQRTIISKTLVYNHRDSTGNTNNRLTCINTSDNVFLLSVQEVNKYMPNEADRKCTSSSATDYAKCFNAATDNDWGYYWMLRSPHDGSDSYFGTEIEIINAENGSITYSSIDYQFYGIKPAITITL